MKIVLTFILVGCTAAFSVTPKLAQRIVHDKMVLFYYPEQPFERAVECAGNYDKCDVDELLQLADGTYTDKLRLNHSLLSMENLVVV